jgi:uncharacterized protein (TIGR02687 family)
MDTTQINSALKRLFVEEQRRIVFWHDPEQEFGSILDSLELHDVTLLRLDEASTLEVKLRLELEDTEGKYLLYSGAQEPDHKEDWLLDIRLYSYSFSADRASIILDQLRLTTQHLREHLAKRRKFFDNKDRMRKLRPLIEPSDIEADLDLKMLAVLAKADPPDLSNIVLTLFDEMARGDKGSPLFGGEADDDGIALDRVPASWDWIEKFDLAEPFWQMIRTTFGYEEEIPSLRNLLIRMLVTDFRQHLKGDIPGPLINLLLPRSGGANAVVCLGQWRDSAKRAASYDRLSEEVASRIKLAEHVGGLELDDLVDVKTFLDVEKVIISGLRQRVQETALTIDAESIRKVAGRRQGGYWASRSVQGSDEIPRAALHAVYEALVAAADLLNLRNTYPDGFDYDDAVTMYRAYEKELYRFDQLYRHFCEQADNAERQGWNVLKSLRESIEGVYVNWYLLKLSQGWGKHLQAGDGGSLLVKWRLEGVDNEQHFYDRRVQPWLDEADNRRAFVIISDAFRFEAAEELTRDLNGQYRFEAELGSHLGVLPSYTALGMASLLPHEKLIYQDNGSILVDGKPTAGIEPRGEILAAHDGIAVKSDELLAMKKEQGRDLVGGKRIVYIYHNVVDAVGDAASTEDGTFEAVRKTIDEIGAIVRYVINHLNGNHVLITADHGFVFTETPPNETDKSKLSDRPDGTVIAKKRYLIGKDLGENEVVWNGHTDMTAGTEGGMEFWIPRGANRFHFVGGAKFIHGGAMLQEIVVPVITVKHRKDKGTRDKTKASQVTVHVLGASHKITTGRHRFELIQMEAVSDRVKPITLKVAVYEGDVPVTNIETVTFSSTSDSMEDRKKWVMLTLEDRQYDKKTAYRLVLRDAETDIEQMGIDVVIDRAFTDDF